MRGTTLLVLAAALCGCVANSVPDSDVRASMARVEQILAAEGYAVSGFATLPAPSLRAITAPIGCRQVQLAYELTRYAVRRYDLARDVQPYLDTSDASVSFETDLAQSVAAVVADDPHLPKCLGQLHFGSNGENHT